MYATFGEKKNTAFSKVFATFHLLSQFIMTNFHFITMVSTLITGTTSWGVWNTCFQFIMVKS